MTAWHSTSHMQDLGRGNGRREDRSGSEGESMKRYFLVIRERLWVIVACTVLVLVAAGAYTKIATKTYEATAQLEVNAASSSSDVLATLPVLHQSGDPTQDVLTGAGLVTTPQVATAVVRALHLDMSPSTALSYITSSPVGASDFVAVQAATSSPSLAKNLADEFVQQTIATSTASMHAAIAAQLPAMKLQLAQTPPAERYGPGSLGASIQELEQLLVQPNPTLIAGSTAALPTAPSSPKTKLTLLAGLIAGLVIGIGAAFALHALDPRIRRDEQVRELLGLPILARIRRERRRGRTAPLLPTELSVSSQEGYRTLRAALTARGSSEESRSFLVTGSGPGEGKSTTAINLAAALAQTGASVILVEADLRRPTFAAAFGLKIVFGVEQVMVNEVDLAQALVPVNFGDKTINVLAARRSGVELADRLSYTVASKLVGEAKELADFVIVDSPPLTAVTDALPFAQLADEIVIVVRLDQDRRNKLVELDDLLHQHGVPATGVVVVGETHVAGDYYHGYLSPVPTEEVPPPGASRKSRTVERVTRQYGWDEATTSAEDEDSWRRSSRRGAERRTPDSPGT